MTSFFSIIFFLLLLISCTTQKVIKPEVKKLPSEVVKSTMVKKGSLRSCFPSKSEDNGNGDYWYKTGNCYKRAGQKDRALFYYKIGLGKNNKHAGILRELTQYHISSKNYSKAYELLRELKDTKDSRTLMKLSVLENYLGHYSESREFLSRIDTQARKSIPFEQLNSLEISNFIALDDYSAALNSFSKMSLKQLRSKEFKLKYLYTLVKTKNFVKAHTFITDRKVASGSVSHEAWEKLSAIVMKKKAELEAQKLSQKSAKALLNIKE